MPVFLVYVFLKLHFACAIIDLHMTLAFRLSKLKTLLRNNRKLVIFGLVIFSFFAFQAVFAVDPTDVITGPSQLAINVMLVGLGVIYNVFAWVLGQLIVLTIGMVLIPILGYNNFADSHVINIAWPLVRDIMNMFVIVILLFIAIQKILGIGKIGVDQAIVKLFAGVVALNFSRTICVLIIDASQVVMFTFVNALRDIAAGNFAGLFNINSLMSVNSGVDVGGLLSAAAEAAGSLDSAPSAFTYLGTAYATVTLLSMILAVMLIMAVTFIYRIVLLWVLVITSPVAFFLIAVKDLLPKAVSMGEWTSKFGAAVVLGPILVFFLWLSLAAAGSGSIAAAENFPSTATGDTTGFLTEAFEIDEIMSIFIGVILLMVGLMVAQGSATQMGFVAKKAFGGEGGGLAGRATRSILTAPARAGRSVGGAMVGGAKVGAKVGAKGIDAKFGLTKGLSKGLSDYGQKTFGGPDANIGSQFGNSLIQYGAGKVGTYSREQRKEAVKTSQENVSGLSNEQFNAQARLLARKPEDAKEWVESTVSPTGQQNMREVGYQVVTDKAKEKQVLKSAEDGYLAEGKSPEEAKKLAKAEVDQIKSAAMSVIGDPEEYFGDDEAAKKKWKTSQVRNAHLLSEEDREKVLGAADVKLSDLSPDAVKNEGVQDTLKGMKRGTRYNPDTGLTEDVFAYDEVLNGKHGAENRKALEGVGATHDDSARVMGNAFKNGHLQIQDVVPEDLMTNRIPDALKAEKFAEAFSHGDVGLESMHSGIQGTILSKLSDLQTAAEGRMAAAQTIISNPATSPEDLSAAQSDFSSASKDQGRYMKARFNATPATATSNPSGSVLGMVAGNFSSDREKPIVQQIVSSQPTQIFKFDTQITNSGTGGSDVTNMIEKTATETLAKKFNQQVDQARAAIATSAAGSSDLAAAQKKIDDIRKSAEAMIAAIVKNSGPERDDRTKAQNKKVDALAATARYAR